MPIWSSDAAAFVPGFLLIIMGVKSADGIEITSQAQPLPPDAHILTRARAKRAAGRGEGSRGDRGRS
jgi:hypothetical protein